MGEGAVPVGGPRNEEHPPAGGPREAHAPSISPREDRPYLRPLRPPPWAGMAWLAALAVLLGGAVAAYYLWRSSQFELTASPRVEPAPAQPAPPSEPTIQYPLAAAGPSAESLPALIESDGTARDALARLVGDAKLAGLLHPDRIIARIVATVDNLPRPSAPVRMLPLKPVPGAFETAGGAAIGARNAARYAPYVALAQAVDARACVDLYVRFYPLFQKAYAELGFPQGYFNDRLFQAIDDLLAAPEPREPVALARPRVLYEFADPDLESRSAGQKVLMRMGNANAAKVKVRLREIRTELAKRSGAR